jgi:hypothetical protein
MSVKANGSVSSISLYISIVPRSYITFILEDAQPRSRICLSLR